MNRGYVKELIEIGKILYKTKGIRFLRDDFFGGDNEEAYEILDTSQTAIEEVEERIINILCERYDIEQNDFVGDGFISTFDYVFNDCYSTEEVIKDLENYDKSGNRVTVILHNLELIKECHEDIQNGVDVEHSRKVFDMRVKLLLEQPEVPHNQRIRYTEMIHKFVNDEVSEDEILDMYDFYIN